MMTVECTICGRRGADPSANCHRPDCYDGRNPGHWTRPVGNAVEFEASPSPDNKLNDLLIPLIRACDADNIAQLDLELNDVVANGRPAGDWRLKLEKIK